MKKFQEFINEEINVPVNNEPDTLDTFARSIIDDIEGDLGEMDNMEAHPYLESIIDYCQSILNTIE